MTDARDDVFAAASRRLLDEHPGDELGRMLHAPGLRTGGKYYAFAPKDGLMVKLPAPRVQELIAAGTGQPCATRPGAPMREWVELAPADEDAYVAYLREARAFVVSLLR